MCCSKAEVEAPWGFAVDANPPEVGGLFVAYVVENSKAEKAGLMPGEASHRSGGAERSSRHEHGHRHQRLTRTSAAAIETAIATATAIPTAAAAAKASCSS